jgi:Domain of unknown function (DUF4345)
MTGLLIHRIVLAVVILIPLTTGLRALFNGVAIYGAQSLPSAAILDSSLRFHGGIWLTIGLIGLWCLFRLPEETMLYRALWLAIFAGGLGRLLSLWSFPTVPPDVYGAIAIELLLGPILVWHQSTLVQ